MFSRLISYLQTLLISGIKMASAILASTNGMHVVVYIAISGSKRHRVMEFIATYSSS